ncbi:MAG: GGDEF domain-containing protein [Rhodoferax sp.]|nr:GGDEF domain-containing protein [Rhodoferax sp.]
MDVDLSDGRWAFVSTAPAGRREIRLALAAVYVSVLVFLVAAPYAQMPWVQVPAFLPVYVSALVICDLITAALLFSQFSVVRALPLLVLAGGYLFTACITLAYALVFPGLFGLSGLPVAGPQTSSAMYMFWHAGFPLVVMAYTVLGPQRLGLNLPSHAAAPSNPGWAIFGTVVGVLAVVGGLTLVATWGHATIPVFLEGDRTTDLGHMFLSGIWLLTLLALALLWRRQPHSVLDIWLQVVLCVWLFDIALAAILNTGRYDLGWYAGRIYGLLAASFLLMVLLSENARQHAHLVRMSVELRVANQALAQLSRQDGLTALANRRYFDEYLAEQIALASRYQRSMALLLCDVDHFKTYNDHYGHPAGDACLKRVATALQACCQRPADMAARYGGEEFAMVLPDTDLAGAAQVAEAVRAAVAGMRIPHGYSSTAPFVSISVGASVLLWKMGMSAPQLIASADQCLYQAKRAGRNQVACVAEGALA